MSLGLTLSHLERDALVELVERHAWNVCAASRELGITPYVLASRLQQQGIVRPVVAPRALPRCGCGNRISKGPTRCQTCANRAMVATRKRRTSFASGPRRPCGMTAFAKRMRAMYGEPY